MALVGSLKMTNATEFRGLPQEPVCSLYPRPSLVPGVSDVTLATVGPTIVYSIFSAVFHWIDVNGFFEQYKIHPSQEVRPEETCRLTRRILKLPRSSSAITPHEKT